MKTRGLCYQRSLPSLQVIDMYRNNIKYSMAEILGRGGEDYRWVSGVGRCAKSERRQLQSFKVEHRCHVVDFKLQSIILHMYAHLCAKRHICRGDKYSYPGCILPSKLCTYSAASTQRGHFFLLHTKAMYVLAVVLSTWIFTVSCLSLCQQHCNQNIHQ